MTKSVTFLMSFHSVVSGCFCRGIEKLNTISSLVTGRKAYVAQWVELCLYWDCLGFYSAGCLNVTLETNFEK